MRPATCRSPAPRCSHLSRLPAGASGGTAQATVTSYFTATGSGSCVSATSAGLTCSVGPAAQSTTGKPLAVKTYTYNQYGEPLTETETFGSTGTVRTATDTYDTAGRPATQALSVTPSSAGGTAIPTVADGYNPATGLPTTKTTSSGSTFVSVTTGYNNIGETTTYTDAAGNISTMGYDLDGRLTSLNDGKGTTTYTYDGGGEHRGMPTSEDIGVTGSPSTFSAAYDAAGNLRAENYPSGLVVTSRFDNEGKATTLSYAKGGSMWMTFTDTYSALGQVSGQTSPASHQTFAYDGDDRLTAVQDTYSAACSTRVYSFDKDSNRTSLKAYPAAAGGDCSTSTTPATNSTSYDQADRDTNTGYTYDDLGRTLTVPSADAVGIGSRSGLTGNLTVGYYANDMVASQRQGSASITFALDPDLNRLMTRTSGGTTTTSHYTSDGDSPTWTSTSATSWTRNIPGLGGSLAATADQAGNVTLQLCNMHGDIVATADDNSAATGTKSYHETTEYGISRDGSSAYGSYGYLGGAERSSDDFGGLIIMGVRLYDPATGRFASVDPVFGGSANAYDYCSQDPVNCNDVAGTSGPSSLGNFGRHQVYWCYKYVFYCHWAKKGRDMAKKFFAVWHNRLTDDVADAFQHVIWMAYVGWHTSFSISYELGHDHELDTSDNSHHRADERRDLDNDHLGAVIGQDMQGQSWKKVMAAIWQYYWGGNDFRCVEKYYCRVYHPRRGD